MVCHIHFSDNLLRQGGFTYFVEYESVFYAGWPEGNVTEWLSIPLLAT